MMNFGEILGQRSLEHETVDYT